MMRYAYAFVIIYLFELLGAYAQDVQGFEQAPSPEGYTAAEAASIGEAGDKSVGLGSSYASKPLVERSRDGSMPSYNLIEGLASFRLQSSFTLLPYLQLRVALPYGFSSGRKTARGLMGQRLNVLDDGSGLNNLNVSIKLPIYRATSKNGLGLALILPQSIPLKNDSREVGQQFFAAGAKLAIDYRLDRLSFAVNAGYRYRLNSQQGDPRIIKDCNGSENRICGNPFYLGNAILYNLAISYRVNSDIQLMAEVYGRYFYNESTNPMEWLIASRLETSDGLYLTFGGGQGLGGAMSAPSFRAIVSLSYTMNSSKDTDLDGIEDSRDQCKMDKEDRDQYQDSDGCPELDNDNDGILDAVDKCPMQPEDMDGFEDNDGCIDVDNDRDGIIDSRDSCPMQPEDVDKFQDSDGCPDDNELSSRVFMMKGQLFAKGNFYFERHRATLVTPQSNEILDNLADAILKNPRIKRVQIESHMDDTLGELDALELTQKRAEAVRDRLLERGVASSGIVPVGYGSSKPLVKDSDLSKKKFNNRIILRVIEMD